MAEKDIHQLVAEIEDGGGKVVDALVNNDLDRVNIRRSDAGKSCTASNGHGSFSGIRRASFGLSRDGDIFSSKKNEGGNSRRDSVGKSSPLRKQDIIPHYLRASTGSCHDLCKYGREHAFEAKKRQPLRKRITQLPTDEQAPVADAQEQKVNSAKQKTVDDAKKHSPDTSEGIDEENLLSVEEIDVSSKGSMSNQKMSPDISIATKVSGLKEKIQVVKQRRQSNIQKPLPKPPEVMRKESSSPAKVTTVALKQTSTSDKKIPPSKAGEVSAKQDSPSTSIKRSKEKKSTRSPSKRASPVQAIVLSSPMTRSLEGLDGRSEGTADIKTNKSLAGRKAAVGKQGLKSQTLPLSPKSSVFSTIRLKPRKTRSTKSLLPLKGQDRVKRTESMRPDEEVSRKKPSQIGAEVDNTLVDPHENGDTVPLQQPVFPTSESSSQSSSKSLSSSSHDHQEETECRTTEGHRFPSEENGNKNIRSVGTRELSNNKSRRKVPVVAASDDKASKVVKVKFRKGKVLDAPVENTAPRRLKFRKARVSSGKADGKSDVSKSLKNKVVDNNKKDSSPVSAKVTTKNQDMVGKKDSRSLSNVVIEGMALRLKKGRGLGDKPDGKGDTRKTFKKRGVDNSNKDAPPGSEKVVLKHQDVQGKKDSQVLLNNVIEETASKLVESKKSKVKALVGAFETVISLQESKPSANPVA